MYTAVIKYDPRGSKMFLNVAFPLISGAAGDGIVPGHGPFNVTKPVGVAHPSATGITVAVNVTAWPKTDGFFEDVIVVLLAAGFTVCESAGDVLARKLVVLL